MVSQRLQVSLERVGVDLFDGLGQLPVQDPPLPGQQLAVQRLPGQGVAEGKLIGALFDHQLGRHQLLDQRQ